MSQILSPIKMELKLAQSAFNHRNTFSSGKEIIIIDPSLVSPEVASFNRLQKLSRVPITYHLPNFQASNDYLQTPAEQISGVIIFGSAASVNDSKSWQSPLVAWIEQVLLPQKIPIFGICYGHQLLHHILGGKVGYVRSDRQKIEGIRLVKLKNKAGLNLESLDGNIVFSHCEHVIQGGEGFENWAENDPIYHEASFHTKWPIWTVQTHPEATRAFYENLGIDYTIQHSTFGFSILNAFLNKLQT